VTREASNEDSDLLDVSNLSDEETGLFPCDREELAQLPAHDAGIEKVGKTEDEAVAALLLAFPGAELVDSDHAAAAEPTADSNHCLCCGAPVTPAPPSVERGWATVCRSCSEAGR
jgi:hypothetical protein